VELNYLYSVFVYAGNVNVLDWNVTSICHGCHVGYMM
jgi:hypothetical protein